jgi:ATP-dependent Clp protease protease subunit
VCQRSPTASLDLSKLIGTYSFTLITIDVSDVSLIFKFASYFTFSSFLCPTFRVDIYNRLYRERIIFLGSEIDDELANQVIGVMLYLDSEDSSKPIYLYINSPGGSVISGLAIFDCMQHIQSEVITINLGLAASMASFILAAGSKGKRLALPSSRTMIHQPMGGAQGQAEDIKVEAAQIMRIRDNLVKQYSMMTGQTQDQVVKDLDRDNFLSAKEACEYGLVDRVLEYNKDNDTQL